MLCPKCKNPIEDNAPVCEWCGCNLSPDTAPDPEIVQKEIMPESAFDWYKKCWKQYADFGGRARRKEYWFFVLFNFLFIISGIIMNAMMEVIAGNNSIMKTMTTILLVLYYLTMLIPLLAVTVRRLHDIGKSGWWLFINFVPFGTFILFIFNLLDSQPTKNKWGTNPKLNN